MKLEELTQEALDALIAEKTKMQGALDRYKNENKKYREEIESNEHVTTFKNRAVAAEAKLALQAKGVKDPNRVLKFLKLDGVDFDEEGNLAGLDEKIDEAKAELPELFDSKRAAGGKGDIFAEGEVKESRDPFEARLDRILSKAGH